MAKLLKLKKGDTIGIICPSFKNPNNSFEKFKASEKAIIDAGFKVKYGRTFSLQDGYLAGKDSDRVKDIEEMFLDEEVKAVLCFKGGYGLSRIVDKIDYNIIKSNPKIFCGFSDITVLLNAIYQQTNIPTFHGLVGFQLGSEKADELSKSVFWHTLTEEINGDVLKNPDNNAKTLVGGVVQGKIVGGNLSLLATLTGSDYQVDFTDKIVFIEEVSEEPYQIDRYMSSLRLAHMLEKARGFVFGYFTDCNPSKARSDTQNYLDVIKDYVESLEKPVIYDFACGHDFPFLTLPIGVEVVLDADNQTIKIIENLYKED